MNSILKSIFLYVAGKMGLELEKKTTQENDFYDVNGISITDAISERISNVTLMGSNMIVEGTNKRAELIQNCANEVYQDHLKNACTFALGTGSALIKPNTDGERFGFDIIPESDYVITGRTGNYIYSVLIKVGEYTENNHTYTLIESQSINKADGLKYIKISYNAFRDDKEVSISTTKWKGNETQIIPNVDRLLFGRIKCPVTNRSDVNSPNGVPITYGLGEAVANAKYSYRNYNKELHDKETLIFADKTVLSKDDNGNVTIPKGKSNLFMKIRGKIDETLIDTYSPEIRETPLDSSIERNFRMIELLAGLGEGILSKSTLTYENLDQVRAMKQATFSFMSSFRKSIDSCVEDLLYAIDMIANYNGMTPQGDYTAYIDWSDEYMTSVTERFNQYMQAESAGWIESAEGRAMLMNEDIDESREIIEKIKGAEPKSLDKQFGGVVE